MNDPQNSMEPHADHDHFDVAAGEYGSDFLLQSPAQPAPVDVPEAPAATGALVAESTEPTRQVFPQRRALFARRTLPPEGEPTMEGTNKPTPVDNVPEVLRPGQKPRKPESLDYDKAFVFFKDLQHINTKHPKRTVLHFDDRSTLVDHGNRAVATTDNAAMAAMRLVALATAKGWSSVKIDGPPEYVRQAIEQAALMGLVVEPKNGAQEKMLVQAQAEQLKRPVATISQGTAPIADFIPAKPAAPPVTSGEQVGNLASIAEKLDAKAAREPAPAASTFQPRRPRP